MELLFFFSRRSRSRRKYAIFKKEKKKKKPISSNGDERENFWKVCSAVVFILLSIGGRRWKLEKGMEQVYMRTNVRIYTYRRGFNCLGKKSVVTVNGFINRLTGLPVSRLDEHGKTDFTYFRSNYPLFPCFFYLFSARPCHFHASGK